MERVVIVNSESDDASYKYTELKHVKKGIFLIKFLFPLLLTIVAFLITYFIIVSNFDKNQFIYNLRFEKASREIVQIVDNAIVKEESILLSYQHFFSSIASSSSCNDKLLYCITKNDITRAFDEISSRSNTINSMGWLPLIHHNERNDFESEISNTYNRTIFIRDSMGNRMSNETFYFPVAFLKSLTDPNLNSIGINLNSIPNRRIDYEKMNNTCLPYLTPRNKLTSGFYGVSVNLYVYNTNYLLKECNDEKRNNILGSFGEAIIIDRMMLNILNNTQINDSISIYLYDNGNIGNEEQPSILYFTTFKNNEWITLNEHVSPVNNNDVQRFNLHFFTRKWLLIIQPSTEFYNLEFTGYMELIVTWGLVLICICMYYFAIHFYESSVIKNIKEKEQMLKEIEFKKKQNFITYIFHEIRVPLNTVKFGIELLKKKVKKPSTFEIINSISEAVYQASRVLNDMLDLEKLESNSFIINKEEGFNVFSLVKSVILQFIVKIKVKKIKITINIDSELKNKTIYGDHSRIVQCLSNFVSNATKFTPAGKISINVNIIRTEKIKVNVETTHGDYVDDLCHIIRFEVVDTGEGIDDENYDKLFKPYTQIKSLSKSEIGTGIGLVIVKKLITLHDGVVGFKSIKNEGSTFFFELPYKYKINGEPSDGAMYFLNDSFLNSDELYKTIPNSSGSESPSINNEDLKKLKDTIPSELLEQVSVLSNNIHDEFIAKLSITVSHESDSDIDITDKKINENAKRILVVDDTSAFTSFLKSILENDGHSCDVAHNGKEGIELFTKNDYNLVIMDNSMPIMTGIEAVPEIIKINPSIKIIGLTGKATEGEILEFKNVGVSYVISKPVENFEHFLNLINE
jgi:signal transduction histidine kinase